MATLFDIPTQIRVYVIGSYQVCGNEEVAKISCLVWQSLGHLISGVGWSRVGIHNLQKSRVYTLDFPVF
jgi:hypothetical protein